MFPICCFNLRCFPPNHWIPHSENDVIPSPFFEKRWVPPSSVFYTIFLFYFRSSHIQYSTLQYTNLSLWKIIIFPTGKIIKLNSVYIYIPQRVIFAQSNGVVKCLKKIPMIHSTPGLIVDYHSSGG